jgi:hypothetical protein
VANIPVNSSQFQGFIKFKTPNVAGRTVFILRIALVDEKDQGIYQNEFEFEVFPGTAVNKVKVFVMGKDGGKAEQLAQQAEYSIVRTAENADVILVDDFTKYQASEKQINELVKRGKKVLFLELTAQKYPIANTTVNIEKTGMSDFYFVSPATGHPLVKNFKPFDFRLWYNGKEGLIAPLLANTIVSGDWTPVLLSTASNWSEDNGAAMAAAELKYGKGVFRICEVKLVDRIQYNPTAMLFMNKMANE